MKRAAVWFGFWLACGLLSGADIRKQTVRVPMRDGIILSADVYRADGAEKAPVLLMRTPYNKNGVKSTAERYAQEGYIVIVQDTRGRYESQGAWFPYNNEGQDGFDTLEWIVRQPWSNGKVGMWGASYVGAVQWQAAAENAPGLVVLAPTATWSSFYRNVYHGGAVRLALIAQAAAGTYPPPAGISAPASWDDVLPHLPLSTLDQRIGWTIPWLSGILMHPRPDGFWKRLDITRDVADVKLPAQHVVGYYDFFQRESVGNFLRVRTNSPSREARESQQLILGPWDHGTIGKSKVGDMDFGPNAVMDLAGENLSWFNRFLKPASAAHFSPIRYFVMGENAWRTARSWPPESSRPAWFYLQSSSRANSKRGDGRLERIAASGRKTADMFRADPTNPAPSAPPSAARGKYPTLWGPVDQSVIEDREDVLVYSTPVLTEPLAFAGPIEAELYVSADTPDADWVVKVVDVHPSGFAQNLAVGLLRSAARESELQTSPLEAGKRYKVTVDLGHAAAKLDRGHILRVDVSGAYFPLFDRNPNTGGGPFRAETRVASQKLFHEAGSASRILLHLINGSEYPKVEKK